MKLKTVYAVMAIILILAFAGCSNKTQSTPTGNVVANMAGSSDKITVYFFWGDGCPHCSTQKPYLEEWEEKYGENIEIKMFETWKNSDNVPLFQEAAQAYGIQAQGVPTTFIGEKHWVGFSSSMAPEMEGYIQSCIENGCESPLK